MPNGFWSVTVHIYIVYSLIEPDTDTCHTKLGGVQHIKHIARFGPVNTVIQCLCTGGMAFLKRICDILIR